MLGKRIITALVLIPLVLAGLIYLSKVGLAIAFAVVCSIGLWEWTNIARLEPLWKKLSFLALNVILFFALYHTAIGYTVLFALVLWCGLAYLVAYYPKHMSLWQKSLVCRLLLGSMIVLPAWQAVIYIRFHAHGLELIFLMLFLIWSTDTGAYFAGRFFGKKLLAPKVSPKKTHEGLYGGVILASLVAILYTQFFLPALVLDPMWIVVLITTILISVVGDLAESMFKRQAGVKDSGNILPGHGGILDRLDSLFAAAPIFAFGVLLVA